MELNMKKELLCLPLALALVACGDNDTEQVAAANQAAKANQSVLSTGLTNPTAVRQTNQLISRATACIYEVFGDANSGAEPAVVSRNLEAVTFNTEERLKQYKEFNKALDGSSWSLPEGNSCE